MRKALVSVLMIPLLLLAGCGEREAKLEKTFSDFRSSLNDAGSVAFRASLTVDTGGAAADYTLDASYDGVTTRVTVAEPSLLAGVTATARRGEASVEYGGVVVGAGALCGDGLTPVSAVPALMEALAGGYCELMWWDGDLPAARYYAGEDTVVTVWLDDGAPVCAEFSSDGQTIVVCRVSGWTVKPAADTDEAPMTDEAPITGEPPTTDEP